MSLYRKETDQGSLQTLALIRTFIHMVTTVSPKLRGVHRNGPVFRARARRWLHWQVYRGLPQFLQANVVTAPHINNNSNNNIY